MRVFTDSDVAVVNFFIRYKDGAFASRYMFHVPRIGDSCVFKEKRYKVAIVEWCLDKDATAFGVRVNVELEPVKIKRNQKGR